MRIESPEASLLPVPRSGFGGLANRPGGRWLLLIATVFVLGFQLWTLRTSNSYWEKPEGKRSDYYNLLSRGFLSGKLSMDVAPDPRLLALENPYPPENRKGLEVLHDASFHNGRYYLYWGPAPALVLFVPFRALTGHDLPPMYAHVLFTWMGFLSLGYLFLRLRSDYFPESRDWVAALGLVALGLGGFTLALLRRNSVWELPIAAGHGFAMTGVLFAYLGLRTPSAWKFWLLSSAAFGLAMASRPTYAAGIACLMLAFFGGRLLLHGFGIKGWRLRASWLGEGFALALPCFAFFLGLLWYNHARFGHPLEFGLSYQLSGANERESTHFTFRYAAHNFQLYYLAPAQWGRYFPFVQLIPSPASQPEGYYGMEYTYGVLANIPLTWFAFLAPLGLLLVKRELRLAYGVVVLGVALFYLGVAVTLLGFWAATQRYMADFTPSLLLLGVMGVLVVEGWLKRLAATVASVGRVILGLVMAGAVAFGMCVSFQLHGLFKLFSPNVYAAVAYACNWPAHAFERLTGFKHGPIELTLKFPEGHRDRLEPLLMTGWEFYSDQVFVHYLDERHVRFGFDHVSRGTKWTPVLEFDYTQPHVLRIEMGSLYPPDQHPLFQGVSKVARTAVRNSLRLNLNGTVIHESLQEFYESAPESIRIGSTCYPRAYGERFTGQILKVSRPGFEFLGEPPLEGGSLALRVAFAKRPPGTVEPLLCSGNLSGTDTVLVTHVSEGVIRLGYEHGSKGRWESAEVPIDYGQPMDLEVMLPGLLAAKRSGGEAPLVERFVVRVNGRVLWMAYMPSFPAEAASVMIGRARVHSENYDDFFSGVVSGVTKVTRDGGPKVNPDGIGMAVLFQPTEGKREPLVVWGTAGAADLLIVEYLPGDRLRFSVDHWGIGLWSSDPIPYDPKAVLNIDIQRTGKDAEGKKRLELSLNSAVVWSHTGKFQEVPGENVAFGINSIGASTCSDTFTGSLVQLEFR